MNFELMQMHEEFRHALDQGLGIDASKSYELTTASKLDGKLDVGAAFDVQTGVLYALVSGVEHQHEDHPEVAAQWLLELAKDLSSFLRTFVVPAEPTQAVTHWEGKTIGPVIAYKFSLMDKPSALRF